MSEERFHHDPWYLLILLQECHAFSWVRFWCGSERDALKLVLLSLKKKNTKSSSFYIYIYITIYIYVHTSYKYRMGVGKICSIYKTTQ